MKNILIILLAFLLMPTICFALDANDSYWKQFEPIEEPVKNFPPPPPPIIYDNYDDSPQRIKYGYNAVGDYVPLSVGDRQIKYGYDSYGNYVPVEY